MKTIAIVGTKGGTGKTTTGGNLGAIAADAGLRTLLIDLDPVQPSLSSYFDLTHRAAGGITELIAQNVTDPALVISRTSIENLSIIVSNDPHNHLITLLLQAPDGRLRLSQLKKAFANDFDLVLIDTQGARTVMLEMVMLACDLVVSPLPPEMLSAREFNRGMLQMLAELRSYEMLGLPIPPIMATVNGLDLTADARQIETALRETFANHPSIHIMDTVIPNAVIYRESATKGTPAHRLEYRQPGNRIAPCALKVFRDLAIELFPGWAGKFEALTEDAVHQLVKAGR